MAKESKENKENRSTVITAISTPMQFGALIVLVIEGLLLYLLNKAQSSDISLYVGLIVGVLVLTILAVFIIEYKRVKLKAADIIPATGVQEDSKKTFKWDVFLAAPMAALPDASFESTIAKVNEIKLTLEQECGFKAIFFAGTNMKTQADFETADVSIASDLNALKDSKIFVMVYTEKIVSSVLYEAGMALALGKPSFYFGKTDNFPFLMKQANQKFTHVKIQEADSLDKIISIIKKNRNLLFS